MACFCRCHSVSDPWRQAVFAPGPVLDGGGLAGSAAGVWPRLLDNFADGLGIRYSPTLLLVCAVGALFIKALHADMVNTRIERQVRRLNQSLALLQIKNQHAANDKR